ncbi:hypothetical protein, variant 1 [Aphanomyces astaci]|uniref:Uncharacterized protein n=1 Tax=Aphanomyces astaci TaxID=112090 RepID=W4H4B4_APHAT|nr:hypothetical protein, variant 1 [Aphanomyces astaci]ETV86732.1 hypothetical protein, variant 1 [Aphanomyces astaci]|eukprot:XP_009823533.1 hypothetical protein, variant 1 [Aphanomyces astaci]
MLTISSVVHNAILLPAWREIQSTLMEHMHEFVVPYKDNPSALQILLSICGDAFAKQFFSSERAHAYLLVEPYMSADTRNELECQLLSQLLAFLAPHMSNMLQSKTMHQLKNSIEESYALHVAALPSTASTIEQAATNAIHHLHGHFFIPPVSAPPLRAAPTSSFLTIVSNQSVRYPLEADATLAAQALVDEANMFQSCHGRSLPTQLRQLLWFRRLYVPDTSVEIGWRLQANQSLLALPQPWTSPISSLLFRLVRDTLAEFPSTAVDDQPRLCDVLNMWYVLTKLQSSHFLYLALPLVRLFPSFDSKESQLVSCLHVFLNKYHRCGVSRSDLYASAQRVWLDVGVQYASLFHHVDGIFAHTKLDLAEKPSQLFVPFDVYCPPCRWIQRAFVGYLPHRAVEFVWDQCMLSSQGWQTCLEHFCVDVCGLLLPQLELATSVVQLEAAMDSGPRGLFTQDVRRAFQLRAPSGLNEQRRSSS